MGNSERFYFVSLMSSWSNTGYAGYQSPPNAQRSVRVYLLTCPRCKKRVSAFEELQTVEYADDIGSSILCVCNECRWQYPAYDGEPAIIPQAEYMQLKQMYDPPRKSGNALPSYTEEPAHPEFTGTVVNGKVSYHQGFEQ
jgi:uncharacterized protein YbaR (Trm112 family)